MSRQGKRPEKNGIAKSNQYTTKREKSTGKRQKKINDKKISNKKSKTDKNSGENVFSSSDALLQFGSQHFGLNFIIREWVALAFRRRSFNLLHKAATLALKKNISFDQIISGKSFPGVNLAPQFSDMKYIADLIDQTKEMIPLPPIMTLNEIPLRLAEAFKLDNVVDRWIVSIKIDQGVQSFYTSPAFERDVVSADTIRHTVKNNEFEWCSLFLSDQERANFHKVTSYLVATCTTPETKPPIVSAPLTFTLNLNGPFVKHFETSNNISQIKVDTIMSFCCEFANVDKVVVIWEFSKKERRYSALSELEVPLMEEDWLGDLDLGFNLVDI